MSRLHFQAPDRYFAACGRRANDLRCTVSLQATDCTQCRAALEKHPDLKNPIPTTRRKSA